MNFKNTRTGIDKFLSAKILAVVGVSRSPNKFGTMLFNDLVSRDLAVFPVNPNMDKAGNHTCYPSLSGLPKKPDGVVIVLPPEKAAEIVKEAINLGIKNIWLQQGSESQAAIDLCLKKQINVVAGECLFMFKEPIKSIHKWHKIIWKVLGRLPRK